jgi:hypothetical protein
MTGIRFRVAAAHLQRLPDRHVKRADAFDLALDLVAGDGGGDA